MGFVFLKKCTAIGLQIASDMDLFFYMYVSNALSFTEAMTKLQRTKKLHKFYIAS